MRSNSAQESFPVLGMPKAMFGRVDDLASKDIYDQLERILASSAFRHSRRYASVLRYVVERTLEGSGDRLKERTIGIEVFDRTPAYDTGSDHVVRSAMAEVRKRLAQYYVESGGGELRIEILPGSYVPQFHRPDQKPVPLLEIERATIGQPVEVAAPSSKSNGKSRMGIRFAWFAVLCAVTIGSLATFFGVEHSDDPFSLFWKPMLSSQEPILLCIGNVEGGQETRAAIPTLSPTLTLREFHNSPFSTVNVYDAFSLAKFAGLLRSNGKTLVLKSQSDATFTDLQRGPTILVGLLNNVWTERLMPNLRFVFEEPSPDKVIIRDRNGALKSDWSINYSTPYMYVTKDYALVLRMIDPDTGQPVVVDAGISVFGTSAAADFLTSRSELKKLIAVAPRNWENKNMEIVLSTDVIAGRYGPAKIIATNFW